MRLERICKILVLCFFSLTAHLASADEKLVMTLDEGSSDVALRNFSFAHISADKKLTSLNQTLIDSQIFRSAQESLPNYGYDRGQLLARFEIENLSNESQWILRLGNPHLKQLRLFQSKENELHEVLRTGVDEPFISRPIAFRDFWLPLTLEPNQRQTFYVLAESAQWLGLVPHLTSPSSGRTIQNREWALQLLCFGGIVAILLYNFFIFFITREKVYLFYVLASIAINIFVIPGCSGLLSYIFPLTPLFAQNIWYASAIGWISLTALFARGFLLKNTQAPIEMKILTWAARLASPLAILPFVTGPNYYVALTFNILSGIFQFVIFMVAWRAAFLRKYPPALIFLSAWGVPILVAVIFVLATQGLYPVSDGILYALTASSLWEVVCMALALGYRIVVLQNEKDRSQAALMEKARLEGELQAARVVQEQLLPLPAQIPGLDLSAFFQPAEMAGGDWYGYVYQEEHSRITFYIGDITGHGITSAVLTGVVCGAVYSAETRSKQLAHVSPPSVQLQLAAESLDSILLNTAGRSGRLMSMCFLTIDLRTGEACALNAGHTWPFLVHQEDGESRCEKIPGGGSLLGTGNHKYGIHEFSLAEGDTLFLYTDGLVENEGLKGEVLNFRKISRVLSKPAPLDHLMSELETLARQIWSGAKLSDDVTFLGIRFHGVENGTTLHRLHSESASP